ncbi:response regulator [Bradyrhizobium sp. CSA112]|uniref:response regulator n=1 Tax=Bradyrhizobium sp. CSA112 TaxID=2699170 RepID=UPI00319E4108
MLKQAGCEVFTYPSAQHFLDRLPSDDVLSCILLDVRLPGMSGPELQERLNEIGSTLPIMFLSRHRADHEGRWRRLSDQASIIGGPPSIR